MVSLTISEEVLKREGEELIDQLKIVLMNMKIYLE